MTDPQCPLGDDCDLTVAWMAGQQEARDSFQARINQLEVQLGLSRADADAQHARAAELEAENAALRSQRDRWCFRADGEKARADLPPTLEQALQVPEVKAMVEALEQIKSHCDNYGIEEGTVAARVVARVEDVVFHALRALQGGE